TMPNKNKSAVNASNSGPPRPDSNDNKKQKTNKKPKKDDASSIVGLKQRLSSIRNKQRRQAAYQQVRQAERKAKEAAVKLRRRNGADNGAAGPAKEPHTLESLRLPDATMTGPAGDAEVDAEEAADEFADILDAAGAGGEGQARLPRLLVTHADEVGRRTAAFCRCLARTVPNAVFCRRRRLPLGRVLAAAKAKEFTAVMIIGEHDKKPCTALLTHLPAGPTFAFRLSSVRLPRELPRPPEDDKPETVAPQVLCNRFHTRLGRRVARGLAAIFPGASGVRRHARVVTFHNQRDYVFFRHHRYILRQPGSGAKPGAKPRCALQEVGPRFTLKLRSLQTGPLGAGGGYEWLHKRHEMDQSRRRFFL
ncbi:hypothetical protein BOX15_Mlig025560g1, partial [Macrostomum lignano]